MHYPFELSDDDLLKLSPQEAVAFFRKLLWAEASFTGISQRLISVPQCINNPDGGLDARIEENVAPNRDDLIPKGRSGYQIKTSPFSKSQCKNEIYVNGDTGTLKPAVQRLMDNGGTYVLALFASIADHTQRDPLIEVLINEFIKSGYRDPKVRVYTSSDLVGFANHFPSVVLSIDLRFRKCVNYEKWGQHTDIFQPVKFLMDEKRSKILDGIRKSLRERKNRCPILRILGLSGLGKTRLVYEALSELDFSHRTIYAYYDDFRGSDASYALENDDELSAIMVIDECDANGHDHLIRRFGTKSERLALITISADYTKTKGDQIVLEPLHEDSIKELLRNENPVLPKDAISRIAHFSEGYPKIAMLLTENIAEYREDSPGDLLRINDDTLINRMVAGTIDPNSPRIIEIKRVLTAFSLLTKVGWKGTLNNESRWLSSKIGYSSETEWNKFAEIVREQRLRRVLQGEHFLYVTPFPLAVHLFRDWIETKADFINLEDFFIDAPPGMIERFQDRIPYMGSTSTGYQVVCRLLGAYGPFADGRLLKTASGAEFFHKLAEAAPEAALERLKKTVGEWDTETLLKFEEGRNHVVWSLEMMAVWTELFQDAANVLLSLGEAETEDFFSNNASGVFCSLFKFGPGPVANTEAPPQVRLPVLQVAIESDSKKRILLSLRACDEALSIGPHTRLVGPEFQGAKPVADLWKPKTYGDLFDAYRTVWDLVMKQVASEDDEIKYESLNVLLTNCRGLIGVTNLFDMVIQGLEKLSNLDWIDKRRIIKEIEEIIHYDEKQFDKKNLNRLISFRDSLIGTDFGGILKRYVGLNLLADRYEGDTKRPEKIEAILNDLAITSVKYPDFLKPHVGWLSTYDAENGYQFGYILGTQDTEFMLLDTLLEGARCLTEPSAFFLGGYFKARFEADKGRWEDMLDRVMDDDKLGKLLAKLTFRSGITKRAAERILKAAKLKMIPIEQFQLFTYGGLIKQIHEESFTEWANFLLEEANGKGAFILLDMFLFYYGRGKEKPFPRDLTFSLLTHDSFFGKFNRPQRQESLVFHWKDMAIVLMKNHPDTVGPIRAKLISSFGENSCVISSNLSSAVEALDYIAQNYPTDTWKIVSEHLTQRQDGRSFYFEQWLRGDKGFGEVRSGAVRFFKSNEIWDWVDENIANRAKIAAGFVPPFLFHSDDKHCYARELLRRYGDREDVKVNLSSNFWAEGWSGSESEHYMESITELEAFKNQESDKNVISWLSGYIGRLQKDLEHARIREELEDR